MSIWFGTKWHEPLQLLQAQAKMGPSTETKSSSFWEFYGGPEGTPKEQVLKEFEILQVQWWQMPPMTSCQINTFWNQTTLMKTKWKQNPGFSTVKPIYKTGVRVGTNICYCWAHFSGYLQVSGEWCNQREHIHIQQITTCQGENPLNTTLLFPHSGPLNHYNCFITIDGIYTYEWHMGMVIHYSFIWNSKNWKPNWPSVGNWLNKLWYLHTVEHYAAMKRKWECAIMQELSDILSREKQDIKLCI